MMENLKENALPKEIMDLVSGGTQAEINDIYNFYKSRGEKMVGGDKISAVVGCLMKDRELFGNASQIKLDSGKGKNSYTVAHTNKDGSVELRPLFTHTEFMNYLITCYAAGRGSCGK